MNTPAALYPEHLATIKRRTDAALAKGGFDHLLVAAGVEKYRFLDDHAYPFRANPHFLHWLPLLRNPHCWLVYTPGATPILAYYQPDDYWHLPPAAPAGFWPDHFDVRVIRTPADAVAHLPTSGRACIIGDADAALPGFVPNNPQAVLDHLHYHRACKTPYELAQMRISQRRAIPGHLAARDAFHAGESEAGIHRAYLDATGHSDIDLPYGNIVGLNEHGATLHYQYQQRDKPREHRSLLIDAGADVAGYATDITRTWGNGDPDFSALLDAMDREQQALCARVRPGQDYKELHKEAHLRLAGILGALDIVRMDPAQMVADGVTATFMPHGLGHLLGLQVHDVAGFAASEDGGRIERPDGHPYLRLTRVLAPGMVVTIEPGLYFIASLLATLRAGKHAGNVNWRKIEHLQQFGGVRIEDDVVCTDDVPENLSRDAFAEAG